MLDSGASNVIVGDVALTATTLARSLLAPSDKSAKSPGRNKLALGCVVSVAVVPERAVCLGHDRTRWMAPHNDPVFAEMHKATYAHEMPVRYAARLAAKWSANLFEGKDYVPGRDGQSGGTPVLSLEDLPDATPLPR